MKIASNRYGKKRVRVLKVLRDGPRHDVVELEIDCLLAGDFDASYAAADNRLVVPTDTMKNTILALAHERLGREIEPFGLELGRHFLAKYPQVARAELEMKSRRWDRQTFAGRPHDHAFTAGAGALSARIVVSRAAEAEVESGIEDLLILKSAGSGFSGFARCDHTTLPETADRVLSTLVRAAWTYQPFPAGFGAARLAAIEAMLAVFAGQYSPSVQATLYAMAGAAFAAVPEIRRIRLALPNRHYLLANLRPFGLENPNITFIPTDEPHGQIEAVIER